jgi:hypothetical protein
MSIIFASRARSVLAGAFLILPSILATANDSASSTDVTFNRDIAPIVFKSCATCHRPGESAPFSLLTYEDARKRSKQIATVTESRVMPPWLPMETDFPFADNRSLSEHEITLIKRWVERDGPEGDPKDMVPFEMPAHSWRLGEPDLVLEMEADFEVPADGPDVYHNFVLPLAVPEGKWIRAVEFRPGARTAVHHSILCLDSSKNARFRDKNHAGQGFPGVTLGYRWQMLYQYAPGMTPRPFPDGAAFAVPPDSDLVLLTHFHPTGRPEKERSKVGIYLTDTPPLRLITDVPIPFAFGMGVDLDIPAEEKNYTLTRSFTLPVESDLVAIFPHAHFLCTDMKARIHFPDGTTKNILWIPKWDFNGQDLYTFREPLRLPANTRVEAEYRYDNSADNPNNPNNPPKRVVWGENTTDEMFHLGLQVMPVRKEDLARIEEAKAVDRAPVVRMIRLRRNSITFGVPLAVVAVLIVVVWRWRKMRHKKLSTA